MAQAKEKKFVMRKWEEWKAKQKGGLKIVALLSGREARLFVALVRDIYGNPSLTHGEKLHQLGVLYTNGQEHHGHKRVVLWAEEANQLLYHIKDDLKGREHTFGCIYESKRRMTHFIYIIASFVVDYWNLPEEIGGAICYYHDTFDVNPHNMWKGTMLPPFRFFKLPYESFSCPICLESCDEDVRYCVACGSLFHKACLKKAEQSGQGSLCSVCRVPWW